jgi:hypothetical protein
MQSATAATYRGRVGGIGTPAAAKIGTAEAVMFTMAWRVESVLHPSIETMTITAKAM